MATGDTSPLPWSSILVWLQIVVTMHLQLTSFDGHIRRCPNRKSLFVVKQKLKHLTLSVLVTRSDDEYPIGTEGVLSLKHTLRHDDRWLEMKYDIRVANVYVINIFLFFDGIIEIIYGKIYYK